MSVDEPHLVSVPLGDPLNEVVDVTERRSNGGGGLPRSEPGLDLQLLIPRFLIGYKLEIQVQVLEIAG